MCLTAVPALPPSSFRSFSSSSCASCTGMELGGAGTFCLAPWDGSLAPRAALEQVSHVALPREQEDPPRCVHRGHLETLVTAYAQQTVPEARRTAGRRLSDLPKATPRDRLRSQVLGASLRPKDLCLLRAGAETKPQGTLSQTLGRVPPGM